MWTNNFERRGTNNSCYSSGKESGPDAKLVLILPLWIIINLNLYWFPVNFHWFQVEFHWISSGIPLNFPVAPGSLVTSDLSLVLAKSDSARTLFGRMALKCDISVSQVELFWRSGARSTGWCDGVGVTGMVWRVGCCTVECGAASARCPFTEPGREAVQGLVDSCLSFTCLLNSGRRRTYFKR